MGIELWASVFFAPLPDKGQQGCALNKCTPAPATYWNSCTFHAHANNAFYAELIGSCNNFLHLHDHLSFVLFDVIITPYSMGNINVYSKYLEYIHKFLITYHLQNVHHLTIHVIYYVQRCLIGISKHEKTIIWISRWDTSSSCLYGFSNESRRNIMFSFADLNRILNQA
jgi:hypothetical protein